MSECPSGVSIVTGNPPCPPATPPINLFDPMIVFAKDAKNLASTRITAYREKTGKEHGAKCGRVLMFCHTSVATFQFVPCKSKRRFLAFAPMNGQEIPQIQWYVPVLILFLVAAGFAFGMILLSIAVGNWMNKWRRKHLPVKDIAYECGMLPVGEGNTRLSVKFYLVAMLFILFDIEVVFLYPWATVYKEMLHDLATRNLIFFSMISFLGVLFVGYIYALKKKAFDWKR